MAVELYVLMKQLPFKQKIKIPRPYHANPNTVACRAPLLGNDREKNNETTPASSQQILNTQN